jgi:RNA polymerase sigma-70 factor (ECF subfamily)
MHPVTTDNPEMKLNAKDLADMIRQLPTGYQTIFNMHAVEGYTHVEIGKMLGINEGTSRSQYSRARTLLISWLKKYSEETKKENYVRP